ncbi:D-2-hydroxyacid dehydrogenase [Aldersonia sp. NBC_00410]|uniref:D-2-hydroxyacid dehydrogenase n=1 Tax=Aldersonia sp. NBC_00410 TaxID=2975954 RepID=UPI00224D3281|nr:D-2-hydroxyacid dehydrogenase [Aldersonia sp. NBC_00410]MCX5043678.1 D-2-hydroxyacid dehydrogenase [Aldersonia sp. NBC_00410]
MSRPVIAVLHADHRPVALDELPAEIRYATTETLHEQLVGADVLLVWDFFSAALQEAWNAADALRWVHVAAAGVDTLLFDELVESDVLVTNSRGIFDRPIAEFVLASMLAFAKDMPASARFQRDRVWQHRETETIEGKRALVVGTGAIGRETARLLRAVGCDVTGAGRRGRADDPDFGVVHESADLADLAPDVDYLILLAPLTDATRGMVDAKVLAALPSSARLINVGRGELVVTDDLVTALRGGTIAGAALDVFDEEPLPADHPLWELDNVLVSPHMSGDATGWRERLERLFVRNFERYAAGEQPLNIVDKHSGYVH